MVLILHPPAIHAGTAGADWFISWRGRFQSDRQYVQQSAYSEYLGDNPQLIQSIRTGQWWIPSMEYYGVETGSGSLQHRPITSSRGRIILSYSVLGVRTCTRTPYGVLTWSGFIRLKYQFECHHLPTINPCYKKIIPHRVIFSSLNGSSVSKHRTGFGRDKATWRTAAGDQ